MSLASFGYSRNQGRQDGRRIASFESQGNGLEAILPTARKQCICGWRHVRRATRDGMDEIPVASFFYGTRLKQDVSISAPGKWTEGASLGAGKPGKEAM